MLLFVPKSVGSGSIGSPCTSSVLPSLHFLNSSFPALPPFFLPCTSTFTCGTAIPACEWYVQYKGRFAHTWKRLWVLSTSFACEARGEGCIKGSLRDSGIFPKLHREPAPIGCTPIRERLAREGTQKRLSGEQGRAQSVDGTESP